MCEYKMNHITSYSATLTPPEVVGEVPEGFRVNFFVTGGSITGLRIFGTFRPSRWRLGAGAAGWRCHPRYQGDSRNQ
jgi:hypothetical protein